MKKFNNLFTEMYNVLCSFSKKQVPNLFSCMYRIVKMVSKIDSPSQVLVNVCEVHTKMLVSPR